jgi:streptogramin lyase
MRLPKRSWSIVAAALAAVLLSGHAAGQVITEFPITTANSGAIRITAGPDGNLWFTEANVHKVGRMTTAGVLTEFTANALATLNGITPGPDGNLWFTELMIPAAIGRITPAGVITEFPTPTTNGQPNSIVAGPDGNLWYTAPSANKIGRVTTAGVITEFPIGTSSAGLTGITVGPDGNLWFCESVANRIGKMTTAGVFVTDYPIPTGASNPIDIAAGADGNLWFTEQARLQVGRITTSGVITEFPTPDPNDNHVHYIAAGPDGNLWVSEPDVADSAIARVTPSGAFTEFPTPTGGALPEGLCLGPDGAIWFVEKGNNMVGRITTGQSAARYYTVTPCRVVDTRNPVGAYGGPALNANADRVFVFAGQCGVPVGARAVAINIATTQPTGTGDLRLFPGGSSLPLTSAINYDAGKTRANDAIIPLGGSGDLIVHVDQGSGTVHAILDVTGYFQ